jgi:small subunit ribosomal protein S1
VEDNPWNKASEKYQVGEIVNGKVARLVPFGAFVELEKGIDGLVHISQISNFRLTKPGDVLQVGQMVEAKIIDVNAENKKISLSIKEVAPMDPPNKVKDAKQEDTTEGEEIPTEFKEEMPVTIGEVAQSIVVDEEIKE